MDKEHGQIVGFLLASLHLNANAQAKLVICHYYIESKHNTKQTRNLFESQLALYCSDHGIQQIDYDKLDPKLASDMYVKWASEFWHLLGGQRPLATG